MKYIVTVRTSHSEHYSDWDNSYSSSEVTALVTKASPAGLATLCKNVDELNILLDMFGRDDLPDIIDMFGGYLHLDKMHLMVRNPSAADIEEWYFSNQYADWVQRKYDEAEGLVCLEHRDVLKQYIANHGDGYNAMLAIAEEKSLTPVSREKYDDVLALTARIYRWAYPKDMRAYFADLHALENITNSIFKLDCCYASKEAKAVRDQWLKPYEATVTEHVEYEDGDCSNTRDITISLFQMPSDGVLVLSESSSSSYCCD